MKYLSVCSGIEAATVAWHHLGWKPSGFSEVEPFPSAVLSHHYPEVTNFGDMTQFKEWDLGNEAIDILVGGTPCQSFSVAGLRQGLKDPRGNLMLTYLGIADRFRPQWIVWENVPGVLSSNGGRDFGTFLGALVELGYGFAYRVLDAQWFGVAQRRRRVFVIGYLGDASRAAKVLFERESVCRNPAPSREKGKGIATNVAPSLTASNDPSRSPQSSEITQQVNAILEAQVAACLRSGGSGGVPSSRGEHLVAARMVSFGEYLNDGTASTLKMRDYKDATDLIATAFHPTQDPISSENISHALGAGSKSGGATTAVAFSFDSLSSNSMKSKNSVSGCNQVEISKALDTSRSLDPTCNQGGMAVAFKETSDCLTSAYSTKWNGNASATNGSLFAMQSTAVRRLTPTECERLQGFPDGYTAIPWRKKPADQCPDGSRYKALGNSMAVPVMRWIGERIQNLRKESA